LRALLITSIATLVAVWSSPAQTKTLAQGTQRIEITLERNDGGDWKVIDPGLVLAQDDRVRFRMRANFDGYLYVTNHGSSDTYQQLFPREETGQNNKIAAGREYLIPATEGAFRIAGKPGYEVIYWLMSPVPLAGSVASTVPSPAKPMGGLLPRCDDEILRARGQCVDSSAGARGIKPGDVPESLSSQHPTADDLLFERKQNTSVVASQAPLTGPALYEFRLAHK